MKDICHWWHSRWLVFDFLSNTIYFSVCEKDIELVSQIKKLQRNSLRISLGSTMGISLSQRVVLFGCTLKLHIHAHGLLKNCRIVYTNDSNVVNRDLEFMGICRTKKVR